MSEPNYSIVINGRTVSIRHEDKNNDGIVQKDENLTLTDRSHTYQNNDKNIDAFYRDAASLQLPPFVGLNIRNWAETHQNLFPAGADATIENGFSKISQFCQENKINLAEAYKLSSGIKILGEDNPFIRLNRLSVVITLLKIKTDGGEFHQKHKKFVGEVLKKIEERKIRIRDARSDETFGSNNKPGLAYNASDPSDPNKRDVIQIFFQLDPSDVDTKESVAHEAYHIFQDIQNIPLSNLDTEYAAFLVGAEYVLREEAKRYPKNKMPSDLPDVILKQTRFKEKPPTEGGPRFHALWAAFYRLTGNLKKAADQEEKLKEALARDFLIRIMADQVFPQVTKAVQNFIQSKIKNLSKTTMSDPRPLSDKFRAMTDPFIQDSKTRATSDGQTFQNYANIHKNNPFGEAKEYFEKLAQYLYVSLLSHCGEKLIRVMNKDYLETGATLQNLDGLKVDCNDPDYTNLIIESLIKYQPSAYQKVDFDGIK